MQTHSTAAASASEKRRKMVPAGRRKKLESLPDRAPAIRVRRCIPDTKASGKEPARYRVRQIFQDFLDPYLAEHGKELTPHKIDVLRAISKCGTGELGYTVSVCPDCGTTSFIPRSCGNSNCPCCGYLRRETWLAERRAEVIQEMSYYHLVFTVPHELNPLIYNNQKLLLDLLFHSVQDALLDLCLEKHNIKPGIIMILHTFGSSMTLHYHLHVLISAGGLTPDGSSFKKVKGFFLPVQKISGQYRKNYMTGLRRLYEKEKLSFNGTAAAYSSEDTFKDFCDKCYDFLWNVNLKRYGSFVEEAKKKKPELPDVEDVINYFGRYTNRTAITSSRIKDVKEGKIIFEYKDYRTDGTYEKKNMELTVDEFIRRFALHILPKGFRKIRMAGYLSGNVRKKNLKRIHDIQGDEYQPCPIRRGMKSIEIMKFLFGKDPVQCPKCSRPRYSFVSDTTEMAIYAIFKGKEKPSRYLEVSYKPRGPNVKQESLCPAF